MVDASPELDETLLVSANFDILALDRNTRDASSVGSWSMPLF